MLGLGWLILCVAHFLSGACSMFFFPPSPYLICSLQGGRVWILDLFMFPLGSALVGGFSFLLGLGSFHLVPFSHPFLGALFYWCLVSFNHHHFFLFAMNSLVCTSKTLVLPFKRMSPKLVHHMCFCWKNPISDLIKNLIWKKGHTLEFDKRNFSLGSCCPLMALN